MINTITQEHSPLPWYPIQGRDMDVTDCNGNLIVRTGGLNLVGDARLLVTAVNAYPKLLEDVATLKEALVWITRNRLAHQSNTIRVAEDALKKVNP